MLKKLMKIKKNKGMSYVELIVVLSIFSAITSVVLFNYGDFQAKVDIKNLASDIALKVVEAQKASLSGELPGQIPAVSPWKPSYGVYLDIVYDNKSFIYFTDLDNNTLYEDPDCTGECLDKISITKDNIISGITAVGQGSCSGVTSFSAVFTRPDSSAKINTNQPGCTNISYVEVNVLSPKSNTAKVKIYTSGRIQIN